MTLPKELMDSFSETLLCDERILGCREKELLTNLLQRANGHDAAVSQAIAQTVGEIVAQRAYEVLGDSITRRLVAQADAGSKHNGASAVATRLGPSPPSPTPHPPGPGLTERLGPSPPSPTPHPPGPGLAARLGPSPPSPTPHPPGPGLAERLGPSPPSPTPHPPGPGLAEQTEHGGVAVLQEPSHRLANCAVFDEFLAPAEVSAVLQFALAHESQFHISEVIATGSSASAVDYDHRRSRVLMDLGAHYDVVVNRIRSCWPRILQKLGHATFVASHAEAQMTASNDGDFFRCHRDNGQEVDAEREITFVYFFHREPKKFRGGELRIYDSRWDGGGYIRSDNYRAVVPQQNQLVVFPSSLEHEITPVDCPSREFADSRFTVNGWFHR